MRRRLLATRFKENKKTQPPPSRPSIPLPRPSLLPFPTLPPPQPSHPPAQALLHHIRRTDAKHNFSPWFYPLYLTPSLADGVSSSFPRVTPTVLALIPFAPQALLVLLIARRFRDNLPRSYFLHALTFVAFNKVVTAQYFVWYLALFPLALPPHPSPGGSSPRLFAAVVWMLAAALWLSCAYSLEFGGSSCMRRVWGASLVFLSANVLAVHKALGWQTHQRHY